MQYARVDHGGAHRLKLTGLVLKKIFSPVAWKPTVLSLPIKNSMLFDLVGKNQHNYEMITVCQSQSPKVLCNWAGIKPYHW